MEWGPILTGVAGILTPIGLGFAWLIKEIVSSSKTAVKELRETNAKREEKLEKAVELWRDRAYAAGWRSKE